MSSDEQVIRAELRKYGQDHLLRFWDELNDDAKWVLISDIQNINLKETLKFYDSIKPGQVNDEKLDLRLKPLPDELHGSINRTDSSQLKEYENEGIRQISDGHVGVLLLAGGQGTRLGDPNPKGMFQLDLPSKKSLFQIQAERILKLQIIAKTQTSKTCSIPWYVMTSPATTKATKEFFERNQYFGLNENDVIMFEQGMLPCFDFNGKILLEEKHKIAKSPDGNGGLYRALAEHKILQDMERRNVKYLHAYCVDNILVRVADPIFIGYCVKKEAECAAKVVEKVSPNEPIGVFGIVDGKAQVVEYSEITEETANMKNSNGTLMFNAGNICNHFFTLEFLKNFCDHYENQMKLHRAEKKIPHVDSEGNKIKPQKVNGVKIEKFVFDVFPFAKNFVVWEVNRNEEFSPLKNSNAASQDNPNTARDAIFKLHRKFIEKLGNKVCIEGPFEISPLLSYAGEGLEAFKDKPITTHYLKSPDEKENSIQNGYH